MRAKRSLILGQIVLATIAGTGCAAKTVQPRMPDHLRGDLGTVAVVMSPDSPTAASLAYPVPSRAGAAAVGAGAGLGVGVLAGAACLGTYGLFWPACVVAIWTPVMMTTGAVEGAVKGVPISDLRISAVAIKDAAREPGPARSLGERIAGEATRRLGDGRGRFVSDVTPGAGPTRYAVLGAAGANTVLELHFDRIALERAMAPGPLETYGPSFSIEGLIDAPLTLVIEVRVRLFRAADGARRWEGAFTHRAGSQKLAEWGRDDAAEFRGERDRAVTALAEDIAATVFGPAPPEPTPPLPPRDDRTMPDPAGHSAAPDEERRP